MSDNDRPEAAAELAASSVAGRLGAIPDELRTRRQWVVWRNTTRAGDKATKRPVQPDGRAASVSDPATWSSFEQAVVALETGLADGVGFVFSPGDPYTGLDLDDCFAGERLHPDARALIDKLSSYTERSPSGNGAHVIVEGNLRSSRNRTSATGWGGRLEVYDHDRYFTFTGDHVHGTPLVVEPRQVELDQVASAALPPESVRKRPPRPANASPLLDLDDEQLLERARRAKNGEKFKRLFDDGNLTGYASPSEADLALVAILAFWTGGDFDRIDRLYRRSGLFRDKWNEENHTRDQTTYGDLTIAAAIEGCINYYDPSYGAQAREARLQKILSATAPAEAFRRDER